MKKSLKAIYAGMSIGLGGIIYLSCENRIAGAFLFSIGLFAVLVFKFDLYTGKVCDISYIKQPAQLIQIWFGNILGAAIIGWILCGHKIGYITAVEIVDNKLTKDLLSVFTDAIICGIYIAVAVKGYKKADGFGKYLSVILGVMGFILCGAEHVVTDAFYLAISGGTTIWGAITFLILVTVGNTVGGVLMLII